MILVLKIPSGRDIPRPITRYAFSLCYVVFWASRYDLPVNGFSQIRNICLTKHFSALDDTAGRSSNGFSSNSSSLSSIIEDPSRKSEVETDDEQSSAIQWELFNKYHVKGSWKGIWTTYDYIGDVIDETVASVNLNKKRNAVNDEDIVEHTHTIVVGAKRSDCETCFDSMETRTFPVATYTQDNINAKCRLAGVSMINGPTLLRSGSMATELTLNHKDGRVRVVYQFAPVWEKGVEPGSCPPQGLKLFRATLSREAVRSSAPTAQIESTVDVPDEGCPIFYRAVPPFNWHKKWSGTSWTYGLQTGDRGWAVDILDETDSWHGITPVDCWNLRLPGGIHLQAPLVITSNTVGICRVAWLPTDDVLLRVEGGISALQPMVLEEDDDNEMIGFYPPNLTSMRCDMLKRSGELVDVPIPSKEWNADTNNVNKNPQQEKRDQQIASDSFSSPSNNSIEAATVPSSTMSKIADDGSSDPSITPRDHLSL